MENIQFPTISLDQFPTMPADPDRRRGLSRALYEEFRARIVAQPERYTVQPSWTATLGRLAEGQQHTLGALSRPWQ